MQDHVANLQLIYGAKTGTSFGTAGSRTQRDPSAARLFGRSPDVVYAVLVRHIAGTPIAPGEVHVAVPAPPIDLREATLALRARAGIATIDAGAPNPGLATWVVVGSTAPASIVLGTAGTDAPDVTVECAIEADGPGSTRLTLFPEALGGNLFGRAARTRKAEDLCHGLMSKVSLAIVQHAGTAQPRSAPREFTRGSALLLLGGATFRGELCDMSAGGVSATIPKHALNADTPEHAPRGLSLHGDVGQSGTLITRLKGAHVALSVHVVHLWPVAHGVRVGMQLT